MWRQSPHSTQYRTKAAQGQKLNSHCGTVDCHQCQHRDNYIFDFSPKFSLLRLIHPILQTVYLWKPNFSCILFQLLYLTNSISWFSLTSYKAPRAPQLLPSTLQIPAIYLLSSKLVFIASDYPVMYRSVYTRFGIHSFSDCLHHE